GVAQIPLDEDAYRERMRTLLGGSTAVLRRFVRRAAQQPKTLVFPEGEDPRILEACRIMIDEGIARPILLGDIDTIRANIAKYDVDIEHANLELVNPQNDPRLADYALEFYRRRQRRGVDMHLAQTMMRRNNF